MFCFNTSPNLYAIKNQLKSITMATNCSFDYSNAAKQSITSLPIEKSRLPSEMELIE